MHWVFLRGLAREARHWGEFPRTFEAAVPGAHVHCLDLPGAGTERHRASPRDVRGIVDDLRARFLTLRASTDEPWGLLAMSLGGMVAMSWCDAYPDDFQRVVLASSSAGDLSAPLARFGPTAALNAVRAFTSRDPVARERHILSMSTRMVKDVDAVARWWAELAIDAPMERANVLRQLRAGMTFRAPTRLSVPALVLAGEGDLLSDVSCSRMLASQLGAKLVVHPRAGHELALDAPAWFAAQVAEWVASEAARPVVTVGAARGAGALAGAAYPGAGTLPWVISPRKGDTGVEALLRDIGEHHAHLESALLERGALLFRGFDVTDAADFERVAKAVGPELGNQYLGTSPRNALTEYTFSASELPPHYPIPQHCEMSFVKKPPRRIFFSCLLPNGGPGGETPLADFRAVLRDLDPAVRARFEQKGVRNVRNYAGPGGGGRFDLWKLKRWDEMFLTTDRAVVERMAAENGFEVTWRPGGFLRLTNTQAAIKPHPTTGEPVWFNHAQVFHESAVAAEYRRIAGRSGDVRYATLARVADVLMAGKKLTSAPDDQAMSCTYGDGTTITASDMDAVRAAIWKNMVFFKWRRGDVLVLDNDSVSHGRMPYRGPRQVAVAWS